MSISSAPFSRQRSRPASERLERLVSQGLRQVAAALSGQVANQVADDFQRPLFTDFGRERTHERPDDPSLDLALVDQRQRRRFMRAISCDFGMFHELYSVGFDSNRAVCLAICRQFYLAGSPCLSGIYVECFDYDTVSELLSTR